MAEIALQDIVDYIDFVKNAKKLANMYKEAFEAYITDKSIPLDLRWSLWLDAPTELKNNNPYLVEFECLPRGLVGWDGDMWDAQKFERIETKELVSAAEQYENVNVDALKEEILQYNLESYHFDW